MNYTHSIRFEWDEAKSAKCLKERGFDFAYAAQAFFDPCRMIFADTRRNYGEDRYQLLGKIDWRLFAVAYTPRHAAIRIISARKANQREVRHYENRTHGHYSGGSRVPVRRTHRSCTRGCND
ncbi:BrnT family toxin [Castellaniella ginsengisoli]|uniref:BrnT family toxin n=1 Tax=Castellaniella ginsengisoli TaxID=546114 RepID=A0AB39D4J5_9BURK